MSDKERLANLKQLLADEWFFIRRPYISDRIIEKRVDSDIEWLIQQAEKLERYESVIDSKEV